VCVINGEPTSLTDTYALIKVLSNSYGEKRVSIVVNNVASEVEARTAFEKLARAVEKFLQVEVRYVGWIPSDSMVRECVMQQRPIVSEYPSSRVAMAIAQVAQTLDEERLSRRLKGGMQFFFRQLLEMSSYGEGARY
jgi:flagellar biosynthesis protein FlhG